MNSIIVCIEYEPNCPNTLGSEVVDITGSLFLTMAYPISWSLYRLSLCVQVSNHFQANLFCKTHTHINTYIKQ